MAKKRTSLDSILPPVRKAASKSDDQVPAPTIPAPVAKKPLNRKQLAVILEQPVYQQLRTIAFEEETKMHPLLLEGLDRVFKDRGLPSIAELLVEDE